MKVASSLFMAAAIFLLPSGRASAQQSPALKEAINYYEYGDYNQASSRLRALLYPLKLSSRDDIVSAHRYLAACLHFLGDNTSAKAELREMLKIDPYAGLDPALFPPKLVTIFGEVRAEAGMMAPQPPQPQREPAPAFPVPAPEPKRGIGLAFVPFGAGQFAKGENTKGTVFLASEAAAFAIFAVSLGIFESKKVSGSFLSGGTFTAKDRDTARALESTYMISFYTGLGLAAIGIIDALIGWDGAAAFSGGQTK